MLGNGFISVAAIATNANSKPMLGTWPTDPGYLKNPALPVSTQLCAIERAGMQASFAIAALRADPA
jgi:hypothetical protein